MAPPDPSDALVERACAALRRLRDAPASREAADAALGEIEAAWPRRPLTIGVLGEDALARTELLNALCGGDVFEAGSRAPGSPPVRVRRGATTRFRAAHRDGSCEEAELPDERQAPELPPGGAPPAAGPWWAAWRPVLRWLAALRARAERAVSRRRFLSRLRRLCDRTTAGGELREIELEIAGGLLTDEVEVLELAGAEPGAEVDVWVRVVASRVELASDGPGAGKDLGPPAEAARCLAPLPIEARALGIAQFTCEVLIAEIARLEGVLARAEVALLNRIARIEKLALPDPEGFIADQLARIHTRAAAKIREALEHAEIQLGAELAQRAARWDEQLRAAGTHEELRALAAGVDEESVTAYRQIADEIGALVMGSVTGIAHDLMFELFAGLRQPELPDELAVPPRGAPQLSPVAMLASLARPSPSTFAGELSGPGQWITGLFRSVEARCTDLRDKVRQHAEAIRATVRAELHEAAPGLLAALLEAGGRALSGALERRAEWLADKLAEERRAVDAGRQALQPIVEVLDDARREAHDLQARVGGRAAAPPAETAADRLAG